MAINENTFSSTIAGAAHDANIAHTAKHVTISSVNIYEFMDLSYYGSGPYRDGRFLVPHSREMFYSSRRELAYYKNYVRPIVRATYTPVFTGDETQRIVDSGNNLFNDFLLNVDNANMSMQEFMRKVIRLVRLHGVTFLVMDNAPAEAMPETIEAARQARAYPYCYIQKAQKVDAYKANRFGVLEWISFFDHAIKNEKNETVYIYRIWTKSEQLLARKKKNQNQKDLKGLSQYEILDKVDHGLNVVPVIPVFATPPDDPEIILPDPPFYDIARINHAVYNKDSEIRDLERSQGFAVLTIQGDNSSKNLTIGNHNILMYPTDATNPPQFISPDAAIMAGLVENAEKLRDDLFRIAEQLGVVGVKTAESGIALGYRFFGQESVLKESAKIASETETKIAELFKVYTGIDFKYSVEYPSDYQPIDLGGEGDRLDKFLMQELTRSAKILALQKYTRLMLGDQEKERLDEAIESFETETIEQEQGEAFNEEE